MRRSKEGVDEGDGDGVRVSQVEWNLIRLDSHRCQQGRY